ncbi:MAG: hypothetical protein ACRDKI_01110 [Solirubrobacterales bacterium]
MNALARDHGVAAAMTALRDDLVALHRPATESAQKPLFTARRAALVIAVACCALVAVVVASSFTDGESQGGSAWAAADLALARQTPELLFQVPGWEMTYFDQYGPGNDSGEMQFKRTRDKRESGIFWVPPRYHRIYVKDRSVYAGHASMVTGDGHRAQVFYDNPKAIGGPNYTSFSALWRTKQHGMRFETSLAGHVSKAQVARFAALLKQVRPVTSEQWLSALPASYLLPGEIPDATQEIMADVPTPTGFTTASVMHNVDASSKGALALRLIMGTECAWIGDWLDARKQSDKATMRYIVAQLAGYKTWKYNKPRKLPNAELSYYGSVYIEALSNGGTMVFGRNISRDVSKDYRAALGCGAR